MAQPFRGISRGLTLAIVFYLVAITGSAQQQPQKPSQDIPDAPSAVRPPQPTPPPPEAPVPEKEPSSSSSQSSSGTTVAPPQPPDTSSDDPSQPQPPLNVKTVPEGGATPDPNAATNTANGPGGNNEELFKIVANVNQVLIPVRVTDDSGRLQNGLLPKDFSIYEEGKKQTLNFFTSDPFALSAAVILDLGMPDIAVQKVNQTFTALQGAFSPYDEVSVYTYSSTVGRATDFGAAGQRLTAAMMQLKTVRGRNNGPPITGGPLGSQGPTVNNVPIDPGAPIVVTPPKESHVINDAILAAALDLSKRDKTRRKIIFIISDGREYRSNASYSDVLKVLLSNGIAVYGVGVEGAAIPGYNKVAKLHIPRFGYSDILPKYASATAGEIFNEYSRSAIESVYTRAFGDARNQYTLGYVTRATPSSAYRQIEVRVARPNVKVFAKDGYYPLPRGLSAPVPKQHAMLGHAR
ncbi:MAG: hypothetical protein NVS1B11_16220 [Terriglobales bacterium]